MNDAPRPTPPGWYPANDMAGTLRYWDGTDWTDHVAPGGQAQPAAGANSGMVAAGVITALLFPIVGFILGCIIYSKEEKAGTTVVVLSIAGFAAWYFILTSS